MAQAKNDGSQTWRFMVDVSFDGGQGPYQVVLNDRLIGETGQTGHYQFEGSYRCGAPFTGHLDVFEALGRSHRISNLFLETPC
ncbi:MAG: hypothetical protein ACPG8W_19240 [Candidatus Promineifilaceae bacterium]